jgi:hypothetical protein
VIAKLEYDESLPSFSLLVYMFSLKRSGSDIVIIPLTDGSCVYMLSFTRSGSHIVIILLTYDS